MPTRIFLLHFSEYQLQDYLPCILMLSYTIQKLSVFPITCTPSLQRMYTYYKQNFSAFQPFFYNQSDNLVDLFFKYRTSCMTAIILSTSSDFIAMLSVRLAYSFRLHMPIHHIYSCKIYQIFLLLIMVAIFGNSFSRSETGRICIVFKHPLKEKR